MIEPTETENKDTLDAFADALIKIAEEAKTQPELLTVRAAHHPLWPHGRGQGGPRAGAVLLAAGGLRERIGYLFRYILCSLFHTKQGTVVFNTS